MVLHCKVKDEQIKHDATAPCAVTWLLPCWEEGFWEAAWDWWEPWWEPTWVPLELRLGAGWEAVGGLRLCLCLLFLPEFAAMKASKECTTGSCPALAACSCAKADSRWLAWSLKAASSSCACTRAM